MGRRLFIGTIATLWVIALATLFTSFSLLFSSPDLVYAQTNNAPAFDGETTTRSVDENTASFSNIGAPVTATDSDTDDRLTYSIENASTKHFTIHQRTGQLQVGGPLDYETKNSYTVTVKATDPSGDSDTIEVTINVNNVDEDGTVTLSWTRPQVGTAITATLTDPDNVSGTPTWQWSRSSSRTGTYTAISGATSATYTPEAGSSKDQGKYLRATASYTDGEGSTKTAFARTATPVRRVPSSNNAPVFGDGQTGQYDCGDQDLTTFCMYARTSDPVGEDIYYPVKATDGDSGDEIRYSLEGTGSEHFYIEPIRGELFTETLPRELTANNYTFTIKASDQSGASDTITVTVTKHGSGRSPVIVGPSRITYPENGTWPVAKYSASNGSTDPYEGMIDLIISVQTRGAGESRDGDFFRINDEGMLLFEQPPDYEEPRDEDDNNTYSFGITAYENNPPSGRSQESYFSVTVTVVNVDESLEILGPSVIDYPENSTDGVHTFTVSGSDGPVTWSPPSGTDGDNFSISQTGTLTFINSPDYENPLDLDGGGRDKDQPDNGYLVAITVEDGTDIKTEHVKVRVTNVNEPPAFDEDLATSFSVEDDIGPSQQVGDPYTASDPDEAANLTYSLSTDTLPFEIDQYNGQLSTKSTLTQFDRTSYTVTVLVTDNADAEGDADTAADDQITITINIVAGGSSNNAPTFPSTETGARSIDENTTTVVNVGAPVTATDGDSDTLAYTLEGTDSGFFTIVSSSGQIQTKANQNYDFETKPSYSVTVKADDNNGGTATKAVTINLSNVEEGGTVTLSTYQPSARAQITATVTDLDGGVTGTTWQWSISTIQNGSYTNITNATSESYSPTDDDVGKFLKATASYTDGHGTATDTAAATTTAAVQDGTNRPPDFGATSTTRDVAENTAVGQPVGNPVAATDADSDTLEYSLTGGDASLFDIDTGTGQIKVKTGTTLDYEGTRKSYTVAVEVTDKKNADGTPNTAMDDSITVTINVTNVNEAPEFDSATATRNIAENSAADTSVGAVITANDPDAGASLTYSLSGTDAGSFTIDNNGQIKVGASTTLDYESAKKSYSVNVEVRDSLDDAGTADTATDDTIVVTINVTDVNEKPSFTDTDPTARSVAENTQAGVDIGNAIAATDPESDTLTYTLSGTNAADFDIVGTSGQLQTKAVLDKEAKASYTVTVSVHDGKNAAGATDTTADDTITVNITITEENDPPEFPGTTATREIAENTGAGVNIGAPVTATDEDSDTLTYSLDGPDKDSFTIVPGTGQIQTKSGETYDFETKPSYSVTVKADDSNGGTATKPVTITLTNVDEDGTVIFSTNQPTARAAITATLTDPDGSISGTSWQWAKSSDGNSGWTNVGTNSSSYTPHDADLNNYLRAKASYTDGQGGGKTAQAQTTQKVSNGTNRAPEFGPLTTTREIVENTAAGGNVGAVVEATDPDTGDTLTYSLTGADASSFTVDNNGQIKVGTGTTLDYESNRKNYTVIVQVHDNKDASGSTDTTIDDIIVVTIYVTNVNEKPTFGETSPTTRSIAENSSAGTNIGLPVDATDPENDTLTYTLSGTNASDFDIVGTSGQLQVKSALDKETKASYTVTVSVRDSKTDAGTADTATDATITVNINVTDANDTPTFAAGTVTRTVAENSGADVDVGSPVTATDLDTGNTLTYTLEGTDKDSFKIVSDSGQVQTKSGVTYDYETKHTYSVTVKADDNNGGTATKAVTITLTNVEEAGTVRLSPTKPVARSPVDATLTDPDKGVTNVTWQWAKSTTQNGSYTNITGATSDTYTPPDDDLNNYLRATAIYNDGEGNGKTATATTTGAVQTGTNRPPTFTDGRTTSRDVAEDAAANANVGAVVAATDQDNDSLTYSLTSTDASLFTVDNTGQIKVGASTTLDYESAKNTYTVVVQVTDSKDPAGDTETNPTIDDIIVVTINVTDVNEPPLKPGKPTVSRASSTSVTVTWTAPDNTGRPPILHYQYQYKKNTDPAWSSTTYSTSGPITSVTIGTLDTGTSYDVQVQGINDEGAGPWSDPGTGNTNSLPDFSSTTAEREVAENTVGVTNVGSPVTATDGDSDSPTYTLEGDDANSFQIVSTSGQIQTKLGVTYDHETKNSYTVTVKASDDYGGTDTIDVTIAVTDVNEPPAFDGTITTREVPDNTPAATAIGGPVTATDPDDGATLTYSLGGRDASSFDIDTSTGQLKTNAALDHETKASYTVTVSVHDGKDTAGGPDTTVDDEITVTIIVTDANDPPEFPSTESGARSVPENTSSNASIGSPVRATDADNDNLTYTLEGTDAGSFTIDESSGQLKTKSPLDHEDKESYTVTVRANDGNGSVATKDVTITVTDVNEAPDFGSETATRNIPENTAANQPVGPAVSAEDPDEGDSLTYSLGGTDSASFGINSSTGQITVGTGTTLDFETTPSYEVTVTATDSSNLSDTITVTINVTEGNDPPVFATDTATRRVAENTPANANLGRPFNATDADNETPTYTLEGTDAASFGIVSTSGQLHTKAALDYESKSRYSVTVKAEDTSGGSSTIIVTITVTDVNEPPLAPGQPDVSEASASSVSVTWTAPANDGRPAITGYDLRYKETDEQSWTSATYYPIPIPSTTLNITRLDASTSYDVEVRAKNDEGTGPWSATGAGSTGNTAPTFANSAVTRDIPENTPADTNIGNPVEATDDDNGDSLTYTLGGPDAASFDIDADTGQLKTKAPLDHEAAKNTYTVIVTATDSANTTDNIMVAITVTNVNEPPRFGPGADNRTVAENTAPGGAVGSPVSAEDDDPGDTLTYSMAGQDSASFGIDSNSGLITVGTGTRLDFETKSTYEVTVTATDSSHLSTTTTVTIEVLNVNEAGKVTLSQLQPQVDTALTASLDDQDGKVSNLTWEWEISSDGNSGWTAITNATSASYTPVSGDIGKFLRVTASYDDGHGSGKTAQAAAPNAVRDVPATNEAPEFPSSETGARAIAENTGAGENVGAPVVGTDGDNDTLTYKLGGVDAPSFSIVSSSGQIQTKAALDHESKSSYTVTVTATDPSRETVTVTVTITVTDVNEPPLLPGIPAMTRNSHTSITMAWTAPSSAGRPAVTDYDYRYKKDTETNWTEVTNTQIPDTSVEITGLEVTTHYDVQVRATNDEGTGDWSLTGIGVTRASPNAAPAFPTQTTTRHVAETAQAQENIGNPVDAQDKDNDDLTYILEGFDANSFMIDEDTGQLKTKMPLDHETKDSYSVMVKAVDGQGGSDSISVNINVLDVNEPPVFSGNLGVHSVPENTGPGVDIGAPVTATDPEDDPLTYSLDSASAQVFAINASTGQLQTKAALDYESARTHSVVVHVSDRKDANGNADTAVDDTISVTITVTDINESPTFTEGAPARVVDENSVIGTNIGDPVTATDPESDTLTYSLGGADAASFSIDSSSGQLKTGTALDFESGQRRYTVAVSVTDGKNADGNSDAATDATVTVTITVTDLDELPTVSIRSTVRYAENGTEPVDTYIATDPESGTISWDISGADVDDFRISKVNNEGVLEFRTPPNFEAPADADGNNVYLVTVEVSDGTNTDNLNVAVTVFNVNEPPAFPAETGSRSIDENTAANQNLGAAVVATDPEGDNLIYRLAGTDAASFTIDKSTGQLKTKAPLDYETKSTYLVTVQVRDSLDQDNRVNAVTDDTIDITININNVEEPGRIEFSSRQPQAATPFRATVIDPDGGVTGTTWEWERSPDKGAWTTITGETSASYTPDATDDDGEYLRVTASYTDGEGSGKSAVGISDNQVRGTPATNDAPEFDSTTATRAVDEGTAAGQPIGSPVAATDPDTDDANLLTYSMTGADAASFAINRATGQLLTKAPLDHETKDRYSVTVKVVDPSLESDTIAVTITVNDVDEPPVLSGPDVVDYPENGADAVARYTATDPEGVTISDWSLDGDDKDLFEIGNAGELTFKSSPDHDIAGDNDGNNIYLVTIKASDGTNTVTLDVEITVSNVNEAPVFPDTEDGARTVAENTAADQNIGDPVAATDPDSGDTLTYTLGGTDAGSFVIDETTGQLKTKAGVTYDHEDKDTYTLTVTATDQAGLYNTVDVTVTVSSVNEVPEFTDGATASRSIAENTPAMQNIGAPLAATDPEDDTLSYTLGGDDSASFSIDEASGQLKTWDPLDYETKSSYSVTVSVSDGKDIDGNADTTVDNTIDVTINVTDQDEDGTVILSSLQPQVDTALTATLVDPDDATNVSWAWAKSTDLSTWTAITTATPDTYTPTTGDLNNYLRATATYANSQNTQVSAHGISAYPVRAAPVNNAAPAFAAATATRSIPEDTPVGSVVGDPVTATDTDTDDVLTYTLSGTDADSFTIGMASGQLRTKVTLDHDTKPSYTVVVTATDPSGLSDTITVTITVTDANEPPVISGKTSIYYSEDRTDAVATYTATDPENGQITWSLAGDDSGDFLISATGVLTFSAQPDRETPADADANNIYLVTVQASDGTNTVPLDVTVTVTDAADPPPAPDAPTVEAAAIDGHTALSVSWQAPTVTGSSPITGYDVEYRKQGAGDWSGENVTINGVTADITNVLPDTVYEVQVRAENADGWGAWSEPGTGRTDVTPLDQQVDLTVSYQAAGYTVNEGATGAVSVTLSAAADRILQIPITVTLTTAESSDYQITGLTSGALAFVPGDSTKSFTFQSLQDTDTDDETVTLGFGQSLPTKVTAGSPSSSVVTIDDDDTAVPRRTRSNSGGSGGGGGGGGNYQGWPSSTNKAPVFTEGDSTTRSVAENTAAGTAIGEAVTATDADKDDLRYTVGGDDGSAFAVDSTTGQLKTKSALDFERKASYTVTMGVFDDNGGSDTITVTISVTDVTDVPLASGSTQMMGVVDSEADTTISTLDGSVSVTFPSGSRSTDYQVRLDYGTTNCDLSVSGEQLWFCLTVDIFDNEGNQEQGVVLSQAATIKIRRNADERGGVDAVLALHEQGGVNVYTRGRTGGDWSEQEFTLESDGVGGIVITITGVSSFGLYAGTTDSLVSTQVSYQTSAETRGTTATGNTIGQAASPEPTPTPTPQPTPAGDQSPTPDPTPTPDPAPTQGPNPRLEPTTGQTVSSPSGTVGGPPATPTPVPTPSGIAKALGKLPLSPPQSGNLVPTAEPEVKVASFDSEGGESAGTSSWYLAIIMMAVAASIAGGSTYYIKKRQRRLAYPTTVQRNREYTKWW